MIRGAAFRPGLRRTGQFPACAGVLRSDRFPSGGRELFPRIRGGDPFFLRRGPHTKSFPRIRGGDPIEEQKKAVRAGIPRMCGGDPYAKSVTIESPALSTHGQGYRRALQTAGTEAASRGGEPCAAVFCALRKGGGSTARFGPRGQNAPHSQFANNSLENHKQGSGRIGATRERSQRIWRGSSCKRKTSCP